MRIMPLLQPRLNYRLTWKDYLTSIQALFSKTDQRQSQIFEILNSEKIYFFDHARSALQIALLTLPKNSKVGVQPLTCPTVFEAIENAGCQVVFIDINDQLVININDLKDKLNEIDALIITHIFGYPAPIDEIISLLNGKLLIEDCAHAFMSSKNYEVVGSKGDFSIFSHGFAKFPSAIQGGWLKVNNPTYFKAIELRYQILKQPDLLYNVKILMKSILLPLLNNRLIYTYFTSKLKNNNNNNSFKYKKKITTEAEIKISVRVCRSVFEKQLNEIDQLMASQLSKGRKILNAVTKNDSFTICQNKEGMNFFLIPVLVKHPDHFIAYSKKHGIEIGKHFVQSQFIINHFGYITGVCKNYEKLVNQLITLPCHYNYPDKEIKRLVQIIESYKYR